MIFQRLWKKWRENRTAIKRKLLLLLGSTVFAVLLAELALRLIGFEYVRHLEPHPERGYAYRPGIEFRNIGEGNANNRINKKGFRDREYELSKPKDCLRIAVLGDSFVAAQEVAIEERFTERLEKELNQRGCFSGKNVVVMNFGVRGYSTGQELMTLRQEVWQYEPDIVILAFLPANDIRDNSKQLRRNPMSSLFVLRDGNLVFDPSFRNTPEYNKSWYKRLCYPLIDRSRVCQLLYKNRNLFSHGRSKGQGNTMSKVADGQEPGLDYLVYSEPQDKIWKDAWEVTEAIVASMNREVVQKGMKFMLVTIPIGVQVHPDSSLRRKLMQKLNVQTLDYPVERIEALGERENFPVVNLAPSFLQHTEKHHTYAHGFRGSSSYPLGFGHYNQLGHHLTAQLIADAICQRWSDTNR